MTLITTVILLLWIVPLAIKAKVKGSIIARMVLGFLMGAIPVVIGAIVINTRGEEIILPALGLTGVSLNVGRAFIAGFGEEGLKLLAALLCSLKMKSTRKIDYILVFGAVGVGFEIMESIAAANDILSLAVRVLFALHVVWLYHEGAKFFDGKNGKKLSLLFGYITVAILHSLFDLAPLALQVENIDDNAGVLILSFVLLLVGVIANIVFIIKTMRRVFNWYA